MNYNKFFSFLGLCKRAGQIVSGEETISINIKKGKLNLLIIAEDASERTKTLYSNQSKKNNIPFIIIGDKITLGSSIGSNFRALVGVKDKKMAENLLKIYARK